MFIYILLASRLHGKFRIRINF